MIPVFSVPVPFAACMLGGAALPQERDLLGKPELPEGFVRGRGQAVGEKVCVVKQPELGPGRRQFAHWAGWIPSLSLPTPQRMQLRPS